TEVKSIFSGDIADRPAVPAVGDCYVSLDEEKLYICYTAGDWTAIATLAAFEDHSARHEAGGADVLSVAGLAGVLADDQHVIDAEVLAVAAALVHAARHETGGLDEVSIAGLLGEGAELATHKAVKATAAILGHVIVEVASRIDVDALGKLTLGAHADLHETGGADVLSVAGLAGVLTEDQHIIDAEVLLVAAALVHAARHETGGADEISVAGLAGVLAADQHVIDAEVVAVALALAGGTMAGNIIMGGNKLTGLAAGVAAGESVRYE
ncbi:unnamed protein product, partial [marine sediment metagenome]